jgi:hypothetical protein
LGGTENAGSAFEIENSLKGEPEKIEKVKRLLGLLHDDAVDSLHIYWFINGGKKAIDGYKDAWRKAGIEAANGAEQPVAAMSFPTCSFDLLPK